MIMISAFKWVPEFAYGQVRHHIRLQRSCRLCASRLAQSPSRLPRLG